MLFVISLVLSAVLATRADAVVKDGVCPDLTVVKNFNVTAYQGVWYEISKYPCDEEIQGQCASAEYTTEGEELVVKNTHVVDGAQTHIEGKARFAPEANNSSAKLLVTLKFGDVTKESPLWVLATDYSQYALTYTCKFDEKTNKHKVYSWVLSRTKTLEKEAKQAVDNAIKAVTELDETKFIQTDFSEAACKFTKTVLITEPPKSA